MAYLRRNTIGAPSRGNGSRSFERDTQWVGQPFEMPPFNLLAAV